MPWAQNGDPTTPPMLNPRGEKDDWLPAIQLMDSLFGEPKSDMFPMANDWLLKVTTSLHDPGRETFQLFLLNPL